MPEFTSPGAAEAAPDAASPALPPATAEMRPVIVFPVKALTAGFEEKEVLVPVAVFTANSAAPPML